MGVCSLIPCYSRPTSSPVLHADCARSFGLEDAWGMDSCDVTLLECVPDLMTPDVVKHQGPLNNADHNTCQVLDALI